MSESDNHRREAGGRRANTNRFGSVVFVMLVLGLFVQASLLGGNRPPVWYGFSVFAGLLLLVVLLKGMRQGLQIPVPQDRWIRRAIVCLGIVATYAFVQVIDLGGLAPHNDLRQSAATLLEMPVRETISWTPDISLSLVLRALGYGLTAFLAYLLFSMWCDRRLILLVLLAGFTIYLGMALAFCLAGFEYLLWIPKWAYERYATGTFVNKNNFGFFCGIGFLVGQAAYFESKWRPDRGERSSNRRAGALRYGGIACCVLASVDLLLSGSKGAMVALAFAIALMMLAAIRSGRVRLASGVMFLLLLLLVAVPALATSYASLFPSRTVVFGESALRWEFWRITFKMIAANPLWGYGYGSFADVFQLFQPPEIFLMVGQAHSSYLETLSDFGIVFGSIGLVGLLIVMGRFVQVAVVRGEHNILVLLVAGVTVLSASHSLVDFSLQIPGLNQMILVLVGLGVAQLDQRARRRRVTISKGVEAVTPQSTGV